MKKYSTRQLSREKMEKVQDFCKILVDD